MSETEAPVVPEEEDEAERESRRLTPAQWGEIVELWELGTANSADIKARFGISRQAISKGLRRLGAGMPGCRKGEIAKAAGAAAVSAAVAEVVDFAEERRRKIEETKRDHYAWATTIARATMQILAKAQKESKPLGTTSPDLQALRHAIQILARAREERYVILDALGDIDERLLPELILRDITVEEIAAVQQEPGDMVAIEPESDPGDEIIIEEGGDGGV